MCLFQLPTTISSTTSAKHKPETNQNFIIQKFQQKSIFIKNFLNQILTNNFNITSLDTILNIYQQKNEKYKQDIYKSLPKLKKDSQLSVDEIIETLQNSPIIQIPSSNPPTIKTKFTASKLKFYVQASDIQTYIKQHYP